MTTPAVIRQKIRRSSAWRSAAFGLALGSQLIAAAQAAPARLTPATTPMSSTADRMISYRFQERSWQTTDGAFHVVINRGALSPSASLVLYSSYDRGATWKPVGNVANTNLLSTADGFLVGNDLTLVYSTSTGTIAAGAYRYDPVGRTWTRQRTETVFADSTVQALSPAVAADSTGALWCAYVTQQKSTLDAGIHLSSRARVGDPWVDTGLIFGSVDNTSIQRSARPIAIPGGMGLLYSVHESIHWATRSNDAAAGAPWDSSVIFTSAPPFDSDPWGGHFSLVRDDANNLHLVTPDHGYALYFRYDYATQLWQSPKTMPGANNVGYVQMSVVDGALMMIVNSNQRGEVYQSNDLGLSWFNSYSLTHAPPSGTITYIPPRLEMAERSTGVTPVLQSYMDGSLYRLMRFSVSKVP